VQKPWEAPIPVFKKTCKQPWEAPIPVFYQRTLTVAASYAKGPFSSSRPQCDGSRDWVNFNNDSFVSEVRGKNGTFPHGKNSLKNALAKNALKNARLQLLDVRPDFDTGTRVFSTDDKTGLSSLYRPQSGAFFSSRKFPGFSSFEKFVF